MLRLKRRYIAKNRQQSYSNSLSYIYIVSSDLLMRSSSKHKHTYTAKIELYVFRAFFAINEVKPQYYNT